MYNLEMVKELFKKAGIHTEVKENLGDKNFYLKVQNGNNIYFWNNEIVSKENILKSY